MNSIKNNIIITLLLIVLFSCKDKNEEIKKNILKTEENKSEANIQENIMETEKLMNLFPILLPSTYRINEDDPTKKLTNDWLELYENDGEYYIEKVNFKIINGIDECTGLTTKTIETDKKTLLLMDYLKLSNGKVNFLPINKKYTWPNQSQSFTFNNQNYTLRAEGITEKNLKPKNNFDDETLWGKVKNYKLYLKKNGFSEQLILSQDNFSDTFVELLFIGDIDRDGNLDFIFGANRDYEENRVLLFLSSETEKGKIIKKVSEISIHFDC